MNNSSLAVSGSQKLVRVVENIRIGLLGAFVIRVWILTCIYEGRTEFKLGESSSLSTGVPLSSHKDDR